MGLTDMQVPTAVGVFEFMKVGVSVAVELRGGLVVAVKVDVCVGKAVGACVVLSKRGMVGGMLVGVMVVGKGMG